MLADPPENRLGKYNLPIAAASCAVLLVVAFGAPTLQRGETDFLSFYAGARLVSSGQLYSIEEVNRIQREFAPPQQVRAYIRPPFYAALLWPLGVPRYHTALFIWQTINLAAFLTFIWIWRRDAMSFLICCWFFPVWMNFALAQDVPLLLVLFATSTALVASNRQFPAGVIFSLCAIKFHLFLLVPVLIVIKRQWKFALGLVTGGAVLFGASVAVAGPRWPLLYYKLLTTNEEFQGSQIYTSNIFGLFRDLPHAEVWIALTSAFVIAGTVDVIRRESPMFSFAFMLFAGVLLSLHSFVYDLAFLAPLLLAVRGRFCVDRAIAFTATVGLAGLALTESVTKANAWLPKVGQISLLIVFAYIVFESRFRKNTTSVEIE